jgi:thermitase
MFEGNFRRPRFCTQHSNLFLLALLVSILTLINATGFAQSRPDKWAEGELLVGLRIGVARERAQSLFKAHGAALLQELAQINVYRISVSPAAMDAVERALGNRPEVQFVERNGVLELASTPNDPYFPSAWHLGQIGVPAAWEVTQGSSNVIVAAVDTGVDPNHPDLVNKLIPGRNTYSGNNDTSDVYGHGTMIAGVMAAQNNNSLGVSSISWSSPIMPIRVTDASLTFFYSVVADGITWAADHGAKVINVSITGVAGSSTVTSAASYARSRGAVVVAAAGNCGCFDSTPANSSIISVSATDGSDNVASFSSQGNYIDIAAPGVSIYTTTMGAGYGAPSGTSVASPIVAGVTALMMSANPTLKPSEIESLLKSTADDFGAAGYDSAYGHGRVNAYQAVAAAASTTTTTDKIAPTVNIDSPSNGSTVSGSAIVNVAASDSVGVARVDLYVDGAVYASDTLTPFSFSWDTSLLADGSHSLAAMAYDPAGNFGTSPSVVVNVSNGGSVADTQPPSVAINSPASTSPGNKLNVSVSATDNVGVAKVELYVDGSLVGSDSAAPYTFSVNTRKFSSGSHSLQAKAYDPSGNVGVSSPSSFTK